MRIIDRLDIMRRERQRPGQPLVPVPDYIVQLAEAVDKELDAIRRESAAAVREQRTRAEG